MDDVKFLLTVLFNITKEARECFTNIANALGLDDLDHCLCDKWSTEAANAIIKAIGLSNKQDIYDNLVTKIDNAASDSDIEALYQILDEYVKVCDIEFEPDDDGYLPEDMPKTMAIPAEIADDEDKTVDYISDDQGYLVRSYC
jgi:hypothetical protein